MDHNIRQSIAIADHGRPHRFGLDLIRAVAIVVIVFEHTLPSTLTESERQWIYLLASADAVVFLMLSGALLLPMSLPTGQFLRRRATRVVTPFIFWSMIYATLTYQLFTGNTWYLAYEIRWMFLKPVVPELWFVAVIIALYLIYPVISPWIRQASLRAMRWYLIIWACALTLPYLRWLMGVDDFYYSIFGSYFGFTGYAVGGFYLTRHPWSQWTSTEKIAVTIVALALGIGLPIAVSGWSLEGSGASLVSDNLSLPVAALAFIGFALLSEVQSSDCSATRRAASTIVGTVAANSFMIYLIHPLLTRYIIPCYCPQLASSWLCFPAVLFTSLILAASIRHTPALKHMLS